MTWWRERSLTVVLMVLCVACTAGLLLSGWAEYNEDQRAHQEAAVSFAAYMGTGHPWEALFENWESEFLQMFAFVVLTTMLIQKGSPESRRAGVVEPYDADPRDHADALDAPWPVRRGGIVLRLYEHSLSLAFAVLFLASWIGHMAGGFVEYRADQVTHGLSAPGVREYLLSSRLWFESFQNWQSEFLAIAAMVYFSVYLRQRGSPESKPVHAAHADHA